MGERTRIIEEKEKTTIMYVLNSSAYSGAENVVLSIVEGKKEQYNCIYVARKGNIEDILKEKNVKYELLDDVSVRNIRKLIKKYNPKLIHAHDFTASVTCSFTFTKVPIISHIHNNATWIKTKCIKSYAYFFATKRFKKILTVSDAIMKEYVFGKRIMNKVQVVGNPVNYSYVIEKSLEKEIKEESDIAFFGRLCEEKNPKLFLEIVKKLKEEKDDISAVMIGDGSLREETETLIKEFGIQGNVKLYGFLKNPHCYIKQTKVVCMPSKWEGFGLTAFEALALGKPVVAAPVGGLLDIVDEECGAFCDSKEAYVGEITKLLLDKDLYSLKSEKAVEKAKKLDNLEKYLEKISNLYSQIIRN